MNDPQPPETTGSPIEAKTTLLIRPPCEPAGPTQPRLRVGTDSGTNLPHPHRVVPDALFAPAHGEAADAADALLSDDASAPPRSKCSMVALFTLLPHGFICLLCATAAKIMWLFWRPVPVSAQV